MTNMERIGYMFKSKEELIDIIDQYKDDMQRLKDGYYQFKIRNRSLESDNDKLKKENEKLILVKGGNAIDHATEITDLKREIFALKRELAELRIKNNEYSRVAKDALDAGFGAAGTIRNLEEENNKLKSTLEFCQKEASSARAHAHNVEVNAERARKGLE